MKHAQFYVFRISCFLYYMNENSNVTMATIDEPRMTLMIFAIYHDICVDGGASTMNINKIIGNLLTHPKTSILTNSLTKIQKGSFSVLHSIPLVLYPSIQCCIFFTPSPEFATLECSAVQLTLFFLKNFKPRASTTQWWY